MNKLDEARNEIHEIDKKIAALFCERMDAVKKVAEHKKEHGLPITDMAREQLLIEKNSQFVADPCVREFYVHFLKNTMEIAKSYQRRYISGMRVAYSGTEGAFAWIAARKLFHGANYIPYASFADAYDAVLKGDCDAVVLPIENSFNGAVGQVADLLFSGSLYINAATEIAVTQDLLGLPDAKIEDITDVYSHSQALGQCKKYIEDHGFLEHEYANTALAAKYVAENKLKNIAAIASAEAAEIYGLKVLAENINQSRSNTTRFIACTRSENIPPVDAKNIHSILTFTVKNEAGALAKAIEVIGRHQFNMTALRSRPMRELSWQYYFYIELEGNVHSKDGDDMLHQLLKCCDRVKVIGTYKE